MLRKAGYPNAFSIKGGITGWQGTAELSIEGKDIPGIAQLTGRIHTMTVARVGTSLSREQREKVESEVTGQAIAQYRAKAADDKIKALPASYQVEKDAVAKKLEDLKAATVNETAFAGYPLIIGDRLVGVMALFLGLIVQETLEGVMPGDAVSVEVLAIEPCDWAWSAAIPGFGLLDVAHPEQDHVARVHLRREAAEPREILFLPLSHVDQLGLDLARRGVRGNLEDLVERLLRLRHGRA